MILILSHAISGFFLTGLIWVIQLVHYPSFKFYDTKTFKTAMAHHRQKISFIVMPLMLIELMTGITLAVIQWSSLAEFHIINLTLIAIIWVHTFMLMVPFHQTCESNFDIDLLNRTLKHHWLRTTAWTLKSALWIATLWHILTIY